jgi:hypothetical protein
VTPRWRRCWTGCWSSPATPTTSAASARRRRRSPCTTGPTPAISGVEHFHSQLTCLAEAAAVLTDPQTGGAAGVLAVVRHDADRTALQLPLARMLADRIVERAAGEPHRAALAILDRFRAEAGSGSWVLATDGDSVVTNGPVRRLSGADQRVLSDLLLSSLVLADVTA